MRITPHGSFTRIQTPLKPPVAGNLYSPGRRVLSPLPWAEYPAGRRP
jgi:hypothetical protein